MEKEPEGYKWKYVNSGSVIVCKDQFGEHIEAMCRNEQTAEVFVKLLNANRKPENCL